MGLENFDLLIFEEDLFFSKLFLILDRSFIFVLIVLVDVDVFQLVICIEWMDFFCGVLIFGFCVLDFFCLVLILLIFLVKGRSFLFVFRMQYICLVFFDQMIILLLYDFVVIKFGFMQVMYRMLFL